MANKTHIFLTAVKKSILGDLKVENKNMINAGKIKPALDLRFWALKFLLDEVKYKQFENDLKFFCVMV